MIRVTDETKCWMCANSILYSTGSLVCDLADNSDTCCHRVDGVFRLFKKNITEHIIKEQKITVTKVKVSEQKEVMKMTMPKPKRKKKVMTDTNQLRF